MTERLRQWHFQLLICKGQEIEASCVTSDPQAQQKFRASRAQWFSTFNFEVKGKLGALVEDLVDNPEAGYQWLHKPQTDYSDGSHILETVFEAYGQLRFKHQANYATFKLQRRTDEPLWKPFAWPAPVLVGRTELLASFCLLGALLSSFFVVIGHFLMPPIIYGAALPCVIVALMILNVAIKAVQDGLAAHEETQRYSDIAGKARYLLTRFEGSRDSQEKLQLMKEMERAALEELKGFLRANSEARFIV
jgi:hypothetical protein